MGLKKRNKRNQKANMDKRKRIHEDDKTVRKEIKI